MKLATVIRANFPDKVNSQLRGKQIVRNIMRNVPAAIISIPETQGGPDTLTAAWTFRLRLRLRLTGLIGHIIIEVRSHHYDLSSLKPGLLVSLSSKLADNGL
jgi:hypothetical protein